jgi:hypothetical protein
VFLRWVNKTIDEVEKVFKLVALKTNPEDDEDGITNVSTVVRVSKSDAGIVDLSLASIFTSIPY